jgi:hypothetical protein
MTVWPDAVEGRARRGCGECSSENPPASRTSSIQTLSIVAEGLDSISCFNDDAPKLGDKSQ